MVIILLAQAAVTPAGNPVAVPMPVAMVVEIVISVKAVFTVSDGVEDGALVVLRRHGVTVVVVLILGELPTPFVAITEKI
jgi:hypothetical protein